MAITLSSLRNSALRYSGSRHRSLTEAKARKRAGFLCHSHKDSELVKGLLEQLRDAGLDLYVDWQDQAMPDIPDRRTAERIQEAIMASDYFVFLATPNSTASRWCPWEIGFADGRKPNDRILIVPTTDGSGNYYGNEYLQLYRQIDARGGMQLKAYGPTQVVGTGLALL